MAKRRGPYKRYLEDDSTEIPRTTMYRWKVNDRAKVLDNTQVVMSQPSASHSEVGNINRQSSSIPRLLNAAVHQNANHNDIKSDGNWNYTSTDGESDVNNSSSEDELDNATSQLDMHSEENVDGDQPERQWSNTSNSEDEELNTEDSTTDQSDADATENEDAVSHSEEDLIDASSSEGEHHSDEDTMEGCQDHADADKPLYPGSSVSKGDSLLMLMSYVLRNNLTGKALTHLLELFNLLFPVSFRVNSELKPMESNPKPAEPGTSAGEADRTPRYSHGYSMIPPNLSRRQATLTVASRGMELYEMQKEKNRPSAIHMDPEQLGGSATQSEARVKQFGDSKNSKWQKRLKKMDLDKKNREEEREKNEKMKAEKRKEAERLEEQKKQEEQTLRDRHDVNRQRVMDTFLKKLEDQSRNAV